MKTPSSNDENRTQERLIALIRTLSAKEQARLLQELEERQSGERRQLPRQACFAPIEFSYRGQVYRDFIQNISAGGLFIETATPVDLGEKIALTFTLPGSQLPIKFAGKVVRTTERGIGIAFQWPRGLQPFGS